jgi:glycosyltransferase involved in cell wall biosynthesis
MERISNLVSVIIPCYNHGRFIRGAVDSILKQSYQNIEIIVVDDGSDDGKTETILNKINLPKTKVYRKVNGGPASARNFGIQKSKGQYILTLDADDKFHPSFLEKAVQILEHSARVGMVTSYITRIYKDCKKKVKLTGGDVSSFITKHEASASLLFRYRCWEDANGYDENIPGFEDWDFAISVTKKEWTVYSIPEYLFYYRNIEYSQNNRDLRIRPKIMRYLSRKHESVFKEHLLDIVYAKEMLLQEYLNVANRYKNSTAQKIGNAILKPLKVMKNLLII